jgi:hypothetical protein
MDDIQIIGSGETDGQQPDPSSLAEEKVSYVFKQFTLGIAFIGEQLAQTYSESNQESAEGFVQSLEKLQELEGLILDRQFSELGVRDRDGLREMLKYLRKKIERRAGAVSANVVNY